MKTKTNKKSKVYLLLTHYWQEAEYDVLSASVKFDELDNLVKEWGLYVEVLNDDFDLTKKYLEEKGQLYLSGADDRIIAAAMDVAIPENKEMYIVIGTGNDWSWEANILGLYPTKEEAWKELSKNLGINKKTESELEYTCDEYKSHFFDNVMTDYNFIYWKWIKIHID